ncbi:MAG: AsmA-like C-terminal region-containing protein, partial [Aestuariivirga sp.]
IQDLTADLPGRSRMKFNGIIFPAQTAAELGGSLGFETSDARAFTQWLWPEGKETVDRLWTGARGRLKAQSDVTWGGQRFGFQNLQYELDGLLGKGDVAVTQGQIPAVHLQLSADKFDLGSYVSGGLSALATQQELLSLLPSGNGLEKGLTLDFGTLTINGVDAQKVSVNVNSNASGFEVKSFDIGAVEGAEVRGNGLVLMSPEGPSGDIKFAIGAARPQGLMRLIGLLPAGAEPKWAQGFGRSDIRADLDIKPGAKEPQVNYSITGTSGPYKLVSAGTLQDFSLSQGAVVGLSGTVSSADAGDILRLLGFESKGTGGGDGQIALTASGNATQGYKTAIDIQGLGATAGFGGMYRPQNGGLGFDGTFALNAEHSDGVFAALGFPLAVSGNGSLALKADTISSADGLKVKTLSMQAGEQSLTGSGQLNKDGALKLDLSGGTLRMIDAVAFAATPWTGVGSFPNGSFEAGWPFGLSGELWLRPQSLTDFQGLSATESVIGISSNKDGRGLSVIGRAAGGEKMQIDGSLKPKGSGYALAGTVHYPLALTQIFKGDGKEFGLRGLAIVDGTFAGEGRSPLSLLNTISGAGKVDLGAGQLVGLAPDPFYAAIKDAKSNDEIQKAFADLATGGGLATPPAKLEFEAKDGGITVKPFALETEQARLSVLPTADLPNGTVTTIVTMTSKSQSDLPDMRMIYEGVPGAMKPRIDATALASKLGTALINKDMAELDRLAQEQKKAEADAAVQAEADKAKFDAYQAQRMELRLQQRMIKVFAQQRAIDDARAKAGLDAAVNYGLSIMKDEKRRLMQLVPQK